MQPTMLEDGTGRVCFLKKSLYGLKQSPRVWYQTPADFLQKLGFHKTQADNSLFISSDRSVFIGDYVDDLLLFGADGDPKVDEVMKYLSDRFKMTDLGDLSHYLGMEVDIDFAAHYESTRRRDAAITKFRNTPLMVEEAVVKTICTPFGHSDRAVIWTVTCGLTASLANILEAIINKFKDIDNYKSEFEVRPRLFNQYKSGTLSIRLADPPPWLGKKLMINEVPLLITAESPMKCSLCRKPSHKSWECTY